MLRPQLLRLSGMHDKVWRRRFKVVLRCAVLTAVVRQLLVSGGAFPGLFKESRTAAVKARELSARPRRAVTWSLMHPSAEGKKKA